MEPKIIFEDKDLLVLDKSAGMIVNRSDTTKGEKTVQDFVEEKILRYKDIKILSNKQHFPNISDFQSRAGIVHRLDKETSGILLVAKTLEAFMNLQAQFKDRKVQKTYIALTHGKIDPEEGEINVSVGRLPWNRKRFGVIADGRESVTRYKILRYYDTKILSDKILTLVELYPKSGRTHQIRVHLQYIKHPIFADPLYAGRKTSRQDRKLLSRVFLHASKISFYHPTTNKFISLESVLPYELEQFLNTVS